MDVCNLFTVHTSERVQRVIYTMLSQNFKLDKSWKHIDYCLVMTLRIHEYLTRHHKQKASIQANCVRVSQMMLCAAYFAWNQRELGENVKTNHEQGEKNVVGLLCTRMVRLISMVHFKIPANEQISCGPHWRTKKKILFSHALHLFRQCFVAWYCTWKWFINFEQYSQSNCPYAPLIYIWPLNWIGYWIRIFGSSLDGSSIA